ncbi:hypothetical protein K437DRAFT_257820 [Tilletiaria anomala UBC 951]|uniref:Maintenance of mitochondrial morphology protein 1 n=1 Tax=Tilletiaria anomala (strain ATCC 24038 / CBS 436.72 / UBC 951) TaxID=1037660 RepID=A0A066VVN8_TILAU|nr:uncharacterized protein K437DRAFT_257820 [Tilletiaria anomala UBC 951]KDN42635.1 hypothetical protein K437DRAFT_257820 [Tilletiaria anomala UBC 951]
MEALKQVSRRAHAAAETLAHTAPQARAPTLSLGSRLTFTQGLLVGQLSIIVIAVIFIRYFIFEDVDTALEKERLARVRRSQQARDRTARRRTKSASISRSSANLASILQNVGYDITSHPSESTDWLNVLLAQAVAGYREDVLSGGAILPSFKDQRTAEKERTARELMQDILNRQTGKAASFLDPIRVMEVDFGDQYPLFSNARIRPADDAGRMRVEVDIDYMDSITIAIDTKLVINMPRPRFAVLPISLSLTISRFSGTLAIELFSTEAGIVLPRERGVQTPSAASQPRSRHHLHFSLHPDFTLDATASSLLGSRAKLQDVPKIEQLLVGRLRAWVHDRFVWPRFWSLSLPNLVPSPGAANDEPVGTRSKVPQSEHQIHISRGVDPRAAEGQAAELDGHERLPNGKGQRHSASVARGELGLEAWRAQAAGLPSVSGSRTSLQSYSTNEVDIRKRFQSSAGGWGRAGTLDYG